MKTTKSKFAGEMAGAGTSRRRALTAIAALGGFLPRGSRAAESGGPIRFAISESLVSDVNLNDARAAMSIWIKRMTQDLNVVVQIDVKVFETTEGLIRRARAGELDAVALNILEYRSVSDLFDTSQIGAESSAQGAEQYVILARPENGFQKLGDLKGRRLTTFKAPKMCLGPAWLTTILDEKQFGPAELFFSSITQEAKASKCILSAFFGQTDCCLTTKRAFDGMCELNPQVGKSLSALAISAPIIVSFYVFRKGYQGGNRDKLIQALAHLGDSPAGRQLATLFQFQAVTFRDSSCLGPALAILARADRVRGVRPAGRKG